jgi:hypothetical protein
VHLSHPEDLWDLEGLEDPVDLGDL